MLSKRIRIKRAVISLFGVYLLYKKNRGFKKQFTNLIEDISISVKHNYFMLRNYLESFYYSEDTYLNDSLQNQNIKIIKSFEKMNAQLENIESAIENLKKNK